jgi:hypothetical protein
MSKKTIIDLITSPNKSDCKVVIGKKYTGKTTYCLNAKHNKDFTIIITPKNVKAKDGNVILIPFDEFIKIRPESVKNAYLLFDDCKYYISHNPNEIRTKKIINYLTNSRHDNNKIRLIYHSIHEINEQIFSKIDSILLFQTNTSAKGCGVLVPNMEEILNAEKQLLTMNLHECIEIPISY